MSSCQEKSKNPAVFPLKPPSRCVSFHSGLKKIRNPERMVRIAVGYTGHAPPKSDDTDANSKRCTNTLTLGPGMKASWQQEQDVIWGTEVFFSSAL